MGRSRFAILMYHEIQSAGRPTHDSSPGYLRYVVRQEEFRDQLSALKAAGVNGVALSAALTGAVDRDQVVLSFDDGCATDRMVAVGCLEDAGFGATFFIVPGFLGRPGYMSPAEVRELSDAGFEIGSHSMRHDFLTALSEADLQNDLLQSKQELEEISGRGVDYLSCPGGRWNRRVATMARQVGYTAVATSRLGVNDDSTDRFRLARIVIRRGTSHREFEDRCRGAHLTGERLRGAMLGGLRALVGDAVYHRVHRRLAR